MPVSSTLEAFLLHLSDTGRLSADVTQRARAACQATGQPIDIVARELGLMREDELAAALAAHCGHECFSAIPSVDDQILGQIGADYARRKALIPYTGEDGEVGLVVADPFDRSTIEAVSFFLRKRPGVAIAPRSEIEEYFRDRNEGAVATLSADDEAFRENEDVDRLLDIAREAPVIRFVSRIIHHAVDDMATDIHIEPFEGALRIRLRKDGILSTFEVVPKALAAGIVSRIKILSHLNIAERRRPQDGRLRSSVRGQEVDFRVSVTPSVHGETIVLRILDRSSVRLDLSALGYAEEAVSQISALAHRATGIVLVTGPTGSGKTTTLYAILNDINDEKLKFFTVEDPVEYRMQGVTQLQVDPSIGLTFATILRSVLRQDPDCILIGEIRDEETARIAVQAALTGHLVLATLHTNSAVGAVSRLRDMGIESYLLAATLRGVIGQRLVRQVCQECGGRELDRPSCSSCRGSGYSGRRAIYEIFEASTAVRDAISRGADDATLGRLANEEGMVSISQCAVQMAEAGLTTREEILRVTDLEGE